MTEILPYTTVHLPGLATWYVLTYSPGGFSNDTVQRAFLDPDNAEAFSVEVRNSSGGYLRTEQYDQLMDGVYRPEEIHSYLSSIWDIDELEEELSR